MLPWITGASSVKPKEGWQQGEWGRGRLEGLPGPGGDVDPLCSQAGLQRGHGSRVSLQRRQPPAAISGFSSAWAVAQRE